MRLSRLVLVVGITVAVGGCLDSTPKLSSDDEKLLDAAAYLFTGLEDNLDDTDGRAMRWQREIKKRSLTFWRISDNRIGSSDPEMRRKTADSRYVRYVIQITSPEPCIFRFDDLTEFSKGDSKEDFSTFVSTNSLNTMTFNLAIAHTFAFEDDTYGSPYLRILGPRIMCHHGPDYCENMWNSAFSGLSLGRLRSAENERRQKAFVVVKNACPGKAF